MLYYVQKVAKGAGAGSNSNFAFSKSLNWSAVAPTAAIQWLASHLSTAFTEQLFVVL